MLMTPLGKVKAGKADNISVNKGDSKSRLTLGM